MHVAGNKQNFQGIDGPACPRRIERVWPTGLREDKRELVDKGCGPAGYEYGLTVFTGRSGWVFAFSNVEC